MEYRIRSDIHLSSFITACAADRLDVKEVAALTMETLAPVNLDLPAMRRVVAREGGCIVWGGAVRLSPADHILIRFTGLPVIGQFVISILIKGGEQ